MFSLIKFYKTLLFLLFAYKKTMFINWLDLMGELKNKLFYTAIRTVTNSMIKKV